jgi:hypothetical protein
MLGELVVRMPMCDRQPGRRKGRYQTDDQRKDSSYTPTTHVLKLPGVAAPAKHRDASRLRRADRSGGGCARHPDSAG